MPQQPAATIPPKILARRTVYAGWARLEVLDVELVEADGRRHVVKREVKDHGHGAGALPFDPARKVGVFVVQARGGALAAGYAAPILEAPAGLIDPEDHDAAATIRRELAEETGIRHARLIPLGAPFASPGSLTERVHLFLAEVDLDAEPELGRGSTGAEEGIAVRVLPLQEALSLAETGGVADMKTLALILALRLRRPELFAD